jgi:CheY-like chemotaxis protein
VKSAAGKGTTFTLEVPAEPVEAAAPGDAPRGSTGRVLVVDDREDVLHALVGVVDELGFECDPAASTAIGANLLAARRYDAVLLDIDMPGKGGAELAADTRRWSSPNRGTRFIGMSAGEATAGMAVHFDALLLKPIDHASLRRVLPGTGQGSRPTQPGLWVDAD